ncbi:MAG: hypothetical protein II675_06495 [Bacteroidaceae bacterium]|nr:hypothetical protein [Bacteroidaceae bacterium]
MKKIYNQPTCLVVELGSRDSLLVTLSATNSSTGLSGTSYGGITGSTITSADVKGISDVNLWDEEW